MTGRYFIETWGCQMNVHDSEKLAGVLERAGYVSATGAAEADVVLLNSCSIREKASEKVFGELGRLRQIKSKRPAMLIGLCGCVAQQEGQRVFARAPYVDFVVGPRSIGSLAETLERLRHGDASARHSVDTEYRADSINFPFDEIRRSGSETAKAFVTVIEGCNHRCTYCIVPRTRGREICRDLDHVLAEVRRLASGGTVEIEFLGQTVNAYRDSRGRTLADLLLATCDIDGIQRIRFTTNHPAQMTDALMDAMARAQPKVCPYLHLPVQSGSSRVLRRMRRGYDREGYLQKIAGLRQRIPEIRLGTDVIVGFPTEDASDFEQTLTLLEEVQYDTVYSFAYSPRPGTSALELEDGTSLATKFERLHRLQALQKAIQLERNRFWVDRVVEVLVEGRSARNPGRWTGRTPEHRLVHFEGDSSPGRLERIRIHETTAFSLRGEPLTLSA